MSNKNNIIELNDILLYNGNDEDFNQQNESLSQPFNFTTIYSDEFPGKKKYIGNIINDKYYGRGILYYEYSGKIKYNGYFKEGIYDGFGKEYDSTGQIYYIGFYSNDNFNGKGNLYEDGKKIYEGNFLNGYYHGIGIEYLTNGHRKRKLIYKEGKIENKCYGILYDENNKEEYKGLLINGKPEKGKSLTFYGENDYIIYKGDFARFKYNGEGCLYFKGENKILFNGIFKDDKYFNDILYYDDGSKQYEGEFSNNTYNRKGKLFFKGNNNKYYIGTFFKGEFKYGTLYDPEGKIIYKGEFKNNNPKEGYNIELYKFDGYLKYKGDFYDFKYHGIGKLYLDFNKISYEGDFKYGLCEGNGILYLNNNEKYEGEFKNGNIHGFGRLYEINDNFKQYLYYEGNFIENEIYGKGIKFYINGSKKIKGTFKSINSYEGKYYNPKGEEIFNGKIINEIPMNFNDITLYNDIGFKVYDGKIYNGGYRNEEKVTTDNKKEINNNNYNEIYLLFLSKGDSGKTCLIMRIEEMKFTDTFPSIGIRIFDYHYQYNKNQYYIKLIDTSGTENIESISFCHIRFCNIIIYLFDLSKDDDISEQFINEIKKRFDLNKKVIYLVGNKLDIANKNLEKYRKKAKKLIDRGKINKYFELSAKTNEGIDIFLNHLKIDCTIMIDKKISDPLNENIEAKPELLKKKIKRNIEFKYNLFKYQSL